MFIDFHLIQGWHLKLPLLALYQLSQVDQNIQQSGSCPSWIWKISYHIHCINRFSCWHDFFHDFTNSLWWWTFSHRTCNCNFSHLYESLHAGLSYFCTWTFSSRIWKGTDSLNGYSSNLGRPHFLDQTHHLDYLHSFIHQPMDFVDFNLFKSLKI